MPERQAQMRKTKPPPALSPADHKAAIVRDGRRVTSYDVALLAGVSQSAVSRCFKPGASVSRDTYARVMKAAESLDYIPNAAARSLITRRSNMVAVLISNVANLYYPEALSELSQQLNRRGKRVLLFTMQQEADFEEVLAEVWQFQVDGVIAAAGLGAAQLAEFARRRVPVVVFNRRPGDQGVSAVVCDQYEGGRMLASRLAAAGHRQFGVIAGPVDSSVGRERLHGAIECLRELGLPEPSIVTGPSDYASGARGLRELISRLGKAPDAVICCNDVMAIGALDCARHELGIDVPGRMSVVGFDAVEPSNWASYRLTTLRQPMQKMALAAADLLSTQIESEGEAPYESRIFLPQFVEGETARLSPAEADFLVA
jgi:DNA-binding LacI/PurR family transcriptional regulator